MPQGPNERFKRRGWRRRNGARVACGMFTSKVTRPSKTAALGKTWKRLNDNRKTRSVMLFVWQRIARMALKEWPSAAP